MKTTIGIITIAAAGVSLWLLHWVGPLTRGTAAWPNVIVEALLSVIPSLIGLLLARRLTQLAKNQTPLAGSQLSTPSIITGLIPETAITEMVPEPAPDVLVYQQILPQLFTSIINYISSTTVPLSDDLLTIRTLIASFLERVQKQDAEIISGETLVVINDREESFKQGLTVVSQDVFKAFDSMQAGFNRLEELIKSIFIISNNIADIAEVIHVLSINASIEAARAGNEGLGFKVISSEIKTLARNTQVFLADIQRTSQGAAEIFQTAKDDLVAKRASISQRLTDERDDFGQLHEVLATHDQQFRDLYQGIIQFIGGLNANMERLAPVLQLHEITVQEIENTAGVTTDLLTVLRPATVSKESMPETAIEPIIQRIRNRLTTARELDALEAGLRALGFQGRIDLKRNNQSIELF